MLYITITNQKRMIGIAHMAAIKRFITISLLSISFKRLQNIEPITDMGQFSLRINSERPQEKYTHLLFNEAIVMPITY